ncbi:MAG: pyocin knob domain-containing protein, partial [Plesiomonas shigelloides]
MAASTLGESAKIVQVGLTETPGTASDSMETLPGEVLRLPVADGSNVGPHQVNITALLNEGHPSLSLTGMGFYLEDGTLFAVYLVDSPFLNHPAGTNTILSLDVLMNNIPGESIQVLPTDLDIDLAKYVRITRTVNGKALSSDITLAPEDVGAFPKTGGIVDGNATVDGQFQVRANGRTFRVIESGGFVYLQAGNTDDENDQKMVISGYNAKPLSFFRLEMKSGVHPFVRQAGVDYRIYHQGYKPTADDVGAIPVGGFGIGGQGVRAPSDNLDLIVVGGLYSVFADTIGTPFAKAPSGSQVMHTQWGENAASQMFFCYTSDRVFWRRKYVGVWGEWSEIYHTKKKPTAAEVGAAPAGFGLGDVGQAMGQSSQFLGYGADPASGEVPSLGAGWQASYAPTRRAQAFLATNGRFYSRFSQSAQEKDGVTPWAIHYTTENKPTALDVGALAGLSKQSALRAGAGWQALARVRIPQGGTGLKFIITGGAGFNVGSWQQCDVTEIIARSGNNNPKGINVVAYQRGGFAPPITDVAWQPDSGDDYIVWVKTAAYAHIACLTEVVTAGNPAFVSWGSGAPAAAKPEGVTDARMVTSYSTEFKPTAADVGGLPVGSYLPRSGSLGNSERTIYAVETGDMNTRPAGDYGLFNGKTVSNSPYGNYFYCETKSIYSTKALIQIAYPYDDQGAIYHRNYSQNSNAWSPWRMVYSSKNKPTAADV